MEPKQLVREGRLGEAVAAATEAVKKDPNGASARIALFELLLFEGNLERAEKQLDVLSQESMEVAYATTFLKRNLDAEAHRREALAGRKPPDFLGDDRGWAETRIAALAGNAADADALEAARTHAKGTLNGKPFADLRDGDDLLAPCLELLAAGRYVWLSWTQLRSLKAEPPRTLRDTFWLPVKLELATGDSCDGVVPVLYGRTHESGEGKMRLGLATDWVEEKGLVRGRGRRVLYADGEEVDLLAVRELKVGG